MLTEPFAQGETPAAHTLQAMRERMYTFDAVEEHVVMAELMREAVLSPEQLAVTQALAARLAEAVRKARLNAGGVDLLTQEFTLDSREGVALMCLAEAMLRVPDTDTRNKLIRDKIVDQDWRSHIGQSPSLFVNAAAWGLALTGKVLKPTDEKALAAALTNVLRRSGEGVVRAGVSFAMRLLGKQFVTGQTIEEALSLARGREKLGYQYSYDMLGEGALTLEDANAYYEAYAHTIEQVGRSAEGRGVIDGPGVSVKLTGLHPRYEVAQRERVLDEMYPKLLQLATAARRWSVGFHLDQEEAARFPLTLEMLERLAHEPALAGWEGLGISLQAYQKRGRAVADWLIALGRATGRRIMVRLVKGAYWDTEIKRCQAEATQGFPVFTRKVHSDVSYLACAKILLDAPDAIFPQFATHNAFSIAAVHTLGQGKAYEFQCLHGMGETVYDQIVGAHQLARACRVYAPVGPHATLLAYLVRRLLENGANSSFVNQVVDTAITIEQIVEDPVARAARTAGRAHPAIAMPRALLPWRDGACAAGVSGRTAQAPVAVEPAVHGAGRALAGLALERARSAQIGWSALPLAERARTIRTVAERLEHGVDALEVTLLQETGMTVADAGEELRNAADLCRFHAAQALADAALGGASPRGPVVALASDRSPLAWPAGQAAAALLTGNPLVLKPAPGAACTALALARVFHACGVPPQALQVLAGDDPPLGPELIAHPDTAMVVVYGARATVAMVERQLAEQSHAPVLLARATECNALVVDSSALPEQVITDAVTGAFDGAGRRGASLKVLCLQDVVADKILGMLGAMLHERGVGAPGSAASDIGPLPHAGLVQQFERYLERLSARGHAVQRGGRMDRDAQGAFALPAIVDLGDFDSLRDVDVDVQGSVLHVVRWRSGKLQELLASVRGHVGPAMLGLHTRIFETAGEVLSFSGASGICVNRPVHLNRPGMQVDGCTPADIGPSPTGAFYLREFVHGVRGPLAHSAGPFAQRAGACATSYLEYPVAVSARLQDRKRFDAEVRARRAERLERLVSSAAATSASVAQVRALASALDDRILPALAGEENIVVSLPRGAVLCAGPTPQATVSQLLYAVACGNPVLLPRSTTNEGYLNLLGADACRLVDVERLLADGDEALVAVMSEADGAERLCRAVGRSGRAISVLQPDADGAYAWWRLLVERQVTVNVSASGGNTQLMATGNELA